MTKSLSITATILLLNTLFFYFWVHLDITEWWYIMRELSQNLYKVVAYTWPMVVVALLRDTTSLKDQLSDKFKWCGKYWVYLIRLAYFLLLLVRKDTVSEHFGAYSVFYVLITNSVVEEVVFRGYIQSKLVALYWRAKWIHNGVMLFL